MTKRNAINPPPLPKTIKTPPVSAEAREIVDGSLSFKHFQDDLQRTIDENTPSWLRVIKGLLRKGK